ncbi:MAG TPA: hypothetical protein VI357_06425, partial [Mycobacteriales bacterium]
MASPVFDLCDRYVTALAALDPIWATMRGVSGAGGAATDYGPAGIEARADLTRSTLAALARTEPAADASGRAGGGAPADGSGPTGSGASAGASGTSGPTGSGASAGASGTSGPT